MLKIFLTATLLLLSIHLSAQSRTIQGFVRAQTDESPLPGVNVRLKDSEKGTITDSKGVFYLSVPTQEITLVFSFIGYVTEEVKVPLSTESIVVEMKEDVKALSEIVVMGYGSEKREAYSASVSAPLTGRVAGVSLSRKSSRREFVKEVPRTESGTRLDEVLTDEETAGKAGILTAGELNDYSKWQLWQDISKNTLLQYQKQWQLRLQERYSVQLVNEKGFPVLDVAIVLRDEQGNVHWKTRSDNTGKGELWLNVFSKQAAGKAYMLEATVNGHTYQIKQPTAFQQGINTMLIRETCEASSLVDIAFVVDATGSMGDEIQFLKAELRDVIDNVKDSLPNSAIRLSSVFYRDHGDEYLTRKTDFSSDISKTVNFIQAQQADGGGDYPEAVEQALQVAVEELSWSKEAKARLLFLVLDAPPHEKSEIITRLQQITQQAAAKGIRIIPIAASGIDKSTEYLMRSLALATNGTYVFLTDDSGVGNPHIKPTTDKYDVELLNKLLVRLITKFTQTPQCTPIPAEVIKQVETAANKTNSQKDSQQTAGSSSDKAEKFAWKYYPNPTKDELHIEFQRKVPEFFVTDITGKIIVKANPTERRATVNMLNYPTGIYFLKAFTGEKWESSRFIVNR